MPNVFLGIESGPTPPCQVVVEPVFSMVAQGAKHVEVGKLTFDYRAGQFLIVSVDLPADARATLCGLRTYVEARSHRQPAAGSGHVSDCGRRATRHRR